MTSPIPGDADPGRQAADQAQEYGSMFEPTWLTLDDGTRIKVPPHPVLRLLDDDVLAALDQLEFDLESYDRHPDTYIPEQQAKDRNGDPITLPSEVRPGALKIPYRKTDPETGKAVLMSPPYDVQQVKLVLGRDYTKLRAGKIDGERGSAAHVKAAWRRQSTAIERRQGVDSKSVDRADVLEAVAAPDRIGSVEIPSPADSGVASGDDVQL